MPKLCDLHCSPCRGGVLPLQGEDLQSRLAQLGDGWRLVEDHHLERTYRFKDFSSALAELNRIAELAEAEGHHPQLTLSWGRLDVKIFTNKIDGLHDNDFILAARIDQQSGKTE